MKAILIEPDRQALSVRELLINSTNLRELLGSGPRRVARLPNGDILIASTDLSARRQFAMGGSQRFAGPAIIVGKTNRVREHRPAKSDVISIKRMIRWF
jgi:hypothetical protein